MTAALRFSSTVLCAAVLLAGCTDAALQEIPPPELERVDNLLRVDARFCTRPDAEVTFPVKVLFGLDQSNSLQCTDPENRRFAALNKALAAIRPRPHVEFGFVGFSSWTRKTELTRNPDDVADFLDPAAGLGPATDYQGALATAIKLIESDMLDTDPSVRSRTRYVIVFVSDGVPEPRCNAGCEDDRSHCSDGDDNDGDGRVDGDDPDCDEIDDASVHPDILYGVCNTDKEIPPDKYVDMAGACPEYNQPRQIFSRIEDLRALQDVYGAGEVTLHTVLMFAPQEKVESVCPGAGESFGYKEELARALLQSMAAAGGGVYREANLASEEDDFLSFDFATLTSRQLLTEFIAVNQHGRRFAGLLGPDSDLDGLADEEEKSIGTAISDRDSDDDPRLLKPQGDRYSDLIEARLIGSGMDPLNAALPAAPCEDLEDWDGDGLIGCEEVLLGTHPRLPDSDGDQLGDRLELVAGTDPRRPDSNGDLDFDGISNREEVRGGTEVRAPDFEIWRHERTRYALTDLGEMEIYDSEKDEQVVRRCYDLSVRDIGLVTAPLGRERGLNRVTLHVYEKPLLFVGSQARENVACVEVFYQGETEKDPVSGVVDLGGAYWEGVREGLLKGLRDVAACAGGRLKLDDEAKVEEEPAEGEEDGGEGEEAASEPEAPRPLMDRDELTALAEACLPPRVRLGDVLHKRADLLERLAGFVDEDLRPTTPQGPHEVFHPVQLYREERHCIRPRYVEDAVKLIEVLAEECAACELPEDLL